MWLFLHLLCGFCDWTTQEDKMYKIFIVGSAIVGGVGIYFIFSKIFKTDEATSALNIIKRKLKISN